MIYSNVGNAGCHKELPWLGMVYRAHKTCDFLVVYYWVYHMRKNWDTFISCVNLGYLKIYLITSDGLFVCGHPWYIGTIWENRGTIWENIGTINKYVGTKRKKCRNLKRLGCAERIALRFSLLSWHKHLQRCGHSYPPTPGSMMMLEPKS